MLNFPTLHQARLAASIALAVLLAVGLTPGASAQIAFEGSWHDFRARG